MYMYKVWYMKHENKIKQNSLSKNKEKYYKVVIEYFYEEKEKHAFYYIYYVHKHKWTNMMKISKKMSR